MMHEAHMLLESGLHNADVTCTMWRVHDRICSKAYNSEGLAKRTFYANGPYL